MAFDLRLVTPVIFILFLPAAVAESKADTTDASAPVTTTICELARSPERFDGKIVSLHAAILIGFERFEVAADECDGRLIDGVWLEYGKGPKRQPTTWCCGDPTPKGPMVLTQNEEFHKFHRDLIAQYKMAGCHEWDCPCFSITATLTGQFNAVKTEICPDGRSRCPAGGAETGFGNHGDASARLVIQTVSEVVATPIDRAVYQRKK
jgi:hypothetical protein